ncbi:hypothetical protein CH63R_00995 [Colletotrichum higginsianum IMI 349063]|uniref:Uncharacterized protein n=1 Tax=Colletotrichum higginsianum (strain IMI 349063) TaxID=759273 RepID=A0A1B7YUU2_COLHI|nr:hypothetical protein CH63R_00995 [Colletotrichum higginsianum IMI 349063]OBR15815.1 hypothetical protein CH63R_00995 [Colletotrichum higginsianum IMI 349063]
MAQVEIWIPPPRNVGDVGHVLANRCLSDLRIFIVVSLFTFLAPSQGAARSSSALEKSLAGRHPLLGIQAIAPPSRHGVDAAYYPLNDRNSFLPKVRGRPSD